MLAMGMLLNQMGKHADLVTADPIPPIYRALPGAEDIRFAIHVHGAYDAVVLLECDGLARTKLRGLEEFFTINIDHHLTGSDFADLNWIDRDAASVGELVYRMVKAAGADLTPEMATCLYTTVLTDTGSFAYGSTSAATFALAHELTLAGADPVRIAQDVYFSTSAARMRRGSGNVSWSKASRSMVPCARRFPSNRVTGVSACSCRRPNRQPIISNCWVRSNARPRISGRRFTSKAIRRRSTRAST